MFSGHVAERRGAGIGPWQQLVDLTVGVPVDDPCDDIGKVAVRLDADELAGLDKRGDDCPVFTAAVRACEQGVLAVEGDRPDGALDDVGIYVDAPILEKAGQTFPAGQRVADRLGELGLLADQGELGAQPGSSSSRIGLLFSWRRVRRSSAVRPRISLSMM